MRLKLFGQTKQKIGNDFSVDVATDEKCSRYVAHLDVSHSISS